MKKLLAWIVENVIKKSQFRFKVNGDDIYVTVKFYGFVVVDRGFDLKNDGFQELEE